MKNDVNNPIDGGYTFKHTDNFTMSKSDGLSSPLLIVYCENHMISSVTAKPLGKKEGEVFEFKLPFFSTEKKRLRLPDLGGTNMGPPVPPPARKAKGRK